MGNVGKGLAETLPRIEYECFIAIIDYVEYGKIMFKQDDGIDSTIESNNVF